MKKTTQWWAQCCQWGQSTHLLVKVSNHPSFGVRPRPPSSQPKSQLPMTKTVPVSGQINSMSWGVSLLVEIPQCHKDIQGTEGLLKTYGKLQRRKDAVITWHMALQPQGTLWKTPGIVLHHQPSQVLTVQRSQEVKTPWRTAPLGLPAESRRVLSYDSAFLVFTCEQQLFKKSRQPLIRMPSHPWQKLRLVHPTPFPPLSGFTVRPHFSGSPAVRLRCHHVTEFCPMNCRQIQ